MIVIPALVVLVGLTLLGSSASFAAAKKDVDGEDNSGEKSDDTYRWVFILLYKCFPERCTQTWPNV